METLHACLLFASKPCDAGVVELCKKIVIADDGYFLRCERDGVLWNPPKSWGGRQTDACSLVGMLEGVSLPEMLAVSQAVTFYDGPGRVEVPTPTSHLRNYLRKLKHTDKKVVLLGPGGANKNLSGAFLRRTDLAIRVAHMYVGDRDKLRECYLKGVAALGVSDGSRSATKVEVVT